MCLKKVLSLIIDCLTSLLSFSINWLFTLGYRHFFYYPGGLIRVLFHPRPGGEPSAHPAFELVSLQGGALAGIRSRTPRTSPTLYQCAIARPPRLPVYASGLECFAHSYAKARNLQAAPSSSPRSRMRPSPPAGLCSMAMSSPEAVPRSTVEVGRAE